jgi:hypothetical protein
VKKFIITETDRKNILKLYGLLNEQTQGNLVSDDVYNAISDIESVFSYTDGSGQIRGNKFSGMEKEENIKNAIQNTIGLKTWFAIDELTRGQIYSFMFQSDSGATSKLRWLAGLTQAIDSSVNRGSIVGKSIQDPNVQNAIRLIQQSVKDGTIGSIYQNYLSIVQQQYQSISGTPNDEANRKKIWGPRPVALDKLMRGQKWDDVKKWWMSLINPQQNNSSQQNKTGQQLSNKQNNSTTWVSSAGSLDELNVKFKTWIKDRLEGSLWNAKGVELYQSGNEIKIKVTIYEDENGYRTFSILFNPKGFPQESKNNALTKNPGSEIITDGIVTFNGKDFEYHLIGLK